jgi:TolB protein
MSGCASRGEINLSSLKGKIVFSSSGINAGPINIYTMNADGTNLMQITDNNLLSVDPKWSPDGTKIVFRTDSGMLYIMDADGGTKKYRVNSPAWSPDGNKIIYSYQEFKSSQPSLYIWDLTSSSEQRLTDLEYGDYAPSWSSRDDSIVFTSSRPDPAFPDAKWLIYTINTDGSGLTPLFIGKNSDWSPDGKQIAFVSIYFESENGDICVMAADGSDVRRLTTASAYDDFPCWSPNGRRILYGSDHYGAMNLFVMNQDGSRKTRLTNHLENDIFPSWALN